MAQVGSGAQWRGWPWVAAGSAALAVVVLVGAVAGSSAREPDPGARGAPEALRATAETVVEVATETETITVTTVSTVTVTPPPPPGPAVEFAAGRHEVGVDVQPGKYKSGGPDGRTCYWARLAGDGSRIIDNGLSDGPVTITVKAGELIEISGCQAFRQA